MSEATRKEDFICAEEHDSASDTFEGEGTGCSFESLIDTDCFGSPALSTEESSWQVGDEAGSTSEVSEWEVYCQNCTEPRDGEICRRCGHDANLDACDFPSCTSPLLSMAVDGDRDVLLVYDDRMIHHSKGMGSPHPERPDRLRAVMSRLLSSGLAECCRQVPCREASVEELERVHARELIEQNRDLSLSAAHLEEGLSLSVGSDLYVNNHTYSCSLLAAGGSAEVAAAVASKEASAGAAIIRPPGHHAESGNSMGFCFFNNAAVAARAAQDNGAKRVLILDWDVHHGNGTQQIFDEDASVLFVSIHRHDRGGFYPGTGAALNVGQGIGEGYSVNIPWNCGGIGDADYIAAMEHVVLPIAREFCPDVTIVSAGFDAAEGDPLGGCKVTPNGYAHLTHLLMHMGPLVLLLEGGYNLKSTALCTEACLKVLLGEAPLPVPTPVLPSPMAWLGIREAIQVQQDYWSNLNDPLDIVRDWGHDPAEGLRWLGNGKSGCSSDSPTVSLSSIPRACSMLNYGQLQLRKCHKPGKSEWNWRLLHRSHESALQAVWRRRRKQLGRQGSLGSLEGSFASEASNKFSSCALDESPSASSSSFQGFTSRPRPNSVFRRMGSRPGRKLRL